MSNTYVDTIAPSQTVGESYSRPWLWARWLKIAVVIVAFLWVADQGISLAIRYTSLRQILAARLESAFGRPVEVGSYDFSLWGGPALNARSVTVGEDPRFGREYFLRAESVSLRLRWQALLRGRMEAGTVSLHRPSLNIVLGPDRNWNLAEWLPRPAGTLLGSAFGESPAPSPALRFRRIEVEEGRLNFKSGYEKLPFAFIGVTGAVETDHPGRWTIDLTGTPWRAAVITQQTGTLHLSGEVGGTSSRLRPATLNATWTEAPISDVLRLVRGDDDGIRGLLSLSISAHTRNTDDHWSLQGRAEFRQIHGWDTPLRTDNPSVNLAGAIDWDPSSPVVELTDIALDAPNSRARGSGHILWNRGGKPAERHLPPAEFAVSSARMDFSDLLAWVRAFHTGTADGLSAHGSARVQASLAGWPLHVLNAEVSTTGIDFGISGLRRSAHLDPVSFRYARGIPTALAASLSWGVLQNSPNGSFRIEVSLPPAPAEPAAWHVVGRAEEARDLMAAANALGLNISRGWDLAGPVACNLRWQGILHSLSFPQLRNSIGAEALRPIGWVEIGGTTETSSGAALRLPFLNQTIEGIKARAELKPGLRHLNLTSAQAFGAHWTGTFDRRDADDEWQFTIFADRLATTEIDGWLNPAWRESLLDRMLPFFNPRPLAVAPESLRAAGRIKVSQFLLPPLHVSRLEGALKINDRRIELSDASGQLYGGQLNGSLDASLAAVPVYHTSFDFSRVDISALTASAPGLVNLLAGSASGQIWLDAHGTSRADLIASLTCQGDAQLEGVELRNFDLWKSLGVPDEDGSTNFPYGAVAFSCAQRRLEFERLNFLSGADSWLQGSGSVDFSRNLDLRLHVMSAIADPPDQPSPEFQVGGSLAAPEVSLAAASSQRRRR
jgi:uncharacterized protein involved in outer membrane biogenesis